MRSTICYSIESNFYIDFIPLGEKQLIPVMFILFSSVIVMDAFLFLLGVVKLSCGKRLFESSFNCFLQFLKYGLCAVGIIIFNCLPKMEI